MPSKKRRPVSPASPPIPTRDQVSAGGVAYRGGAGRWEFALILTGTPARPRWQLPKGLVDEGESPEATAVREVREEAGIETELVAPLERIEYWYVGTERGGQRVRYHKFVHFFLLRYLAGDVADHDHEVQEARWFPVGEAAAILAFPSERKVVEQAAGLLP
jgi:8-oxo-dGTP pyrophosphatase MutT (NUDIX family)